MLYAFVTRNLGKEKSKNPAGAKMSSENKSAEREGTGKMEVEAMRWGWTKKATRGQLEGGVEALPRREHEKFAVSYRGVL